MKVYILGILFLCLLYIGCGILEPEEEVLRWDDIHGYWISTSSYYPFTFTEDLQPYTYRPKSYYIFDYNRAELYEEEWSGFSYITCSWEYFSTKVFAANSITITEAGEYSTEEGKEVVTLDWSRYTRAAVSNEWIRVYEYSFLQSYVLLDMNETQDTLVIGYCDSYTCGGNQFWETGHYDTDVLVRISEAEFNRISSQWWYY